MPTPDLCGKSTPVICRESLGSKTKAEQKQYPRKCLLKKKTQGKQLPV
jgi:hypothetical protein